MKFRPRCSMPLERRCAYTMSKRGGIVSASDARVARPRVAASKRGGTVSMVTEYGIVSAVGRALWFSRPAERLAPSAAPDCSRSLGETVGRPAKADGRELREQAAPRLP